MINRLWLKTIPKKVSVDEQETYEPIGSCRMEAMAFKKVTCMSFLDVFHHSPTLILSFEAWFYSCL